jgi:hypothetical protein
LEYFLFNTLKKFIRVAKHDYREESLKNNQRKIIKQEIELELISNDNSDDFILSPKLTKKYDDS